MTKGKKRDMSLERKWRRMVQRQQRSGLSIREFCRRGALAEASFGFWKRELRRRDGEASRIPSFVELAPIAAAAAVQESPIELHVAGRHLLLRQGCSIELLSKVLQMLEARPC